MWYCVGFVCGIDQCEGPLREGFSVSVREIPAVRLEADFSTALSLSLRPKQRNCLFPVMV